MAEVWMYFHKANDVVRCNGCAYETPNARDSPAHFDTLWEHLSFAHRDVYERSNHFSTVRPSPMTTPKRVRQSFSNVASEAWSHFAKLLDNRVQCTLCSNKMALKKNGSTSDLWRHLRSHHIAVYETTQHFKVLSALSTTPSRNKSEVWTHFTRTNTSLVKCNACSREFRQGARSHSFTTTLWNHLKASHSDIYRTTGHSELAISNSTVNQHSEAVGSSQDHPPAKRRCSANEASFDAFYETLKECFARVDPDKVEETKATILDVVKAASSRG